MHNADFKATTVLAGAAVEALLLWAIRQEPIEDRDKATRASLDNGALTTKPKGDLERWGLPELIEVGGELGLISKDAVSQCRLAKDFRNLIHPGRSVRLGQVCNRATALSACAALHHVVIDLTSRRAGT